MRKYSIETSDVTELMLRPSAFSRLFMAYSSEVNCRLRAAIATSVERAYDHRRRAFFRISEALSSGLSASRCLPEHTWLLYRGCSDEVPTDAIVSAAQMLEYSSDSSPLRWMWKGQASPWVYYGLSLIQQDLQSFYPKAAPQLAVEPYCSAIESALSLIDSSIPHVAQVIRKAISTVVFASGDSLQSASTPMTFGAIYLGVRPTWTAVDYADLLVHETAHHELVMRSAFVRFLTNPFDIVRSPLRHDRRPLEAVLHAVFVLTRVLDVMKAFAKLEDASIRERAVEKLNYYAVLLNEGILTLRQSAEWTRAGTHLFEQLGQNAGSWCPERA
jgi:hypothetical protein